MCGLCENALSRSSLASLAANSTAAPPFEPMTAALLDQFESGSQNGVVSGAGAPALVIGTATDAAFVANVQAQVGQVVPPAGFSFTMSIEPAVPGIPAVPATDANRIGASTYNFFDISYSQRVRIETRGGDDYVQLGTNMAAPISSALGKAVCLPLSPSMVR